VGPVRDVEVASFPLTGAKPAPRLTPGDLERIRGALPVRRSELEAIAKEAAERAHERTPRPRRTRAQMVAIADRYGDRPPPVAPPAPVLRPVVPRASRTPERRPSRAGSTARMAPATRSRCSSADDADDSGEPALTPPLASPTTGGGGLEVGLRELVQERRSDLLSAALVGDGALDRLLAGRGRRS
jgi:hypothetical protein